jgi:Tfp pilus assembly protein PilF
MLLERGRAREALAAFEAALVKEPNRYNGFAGAARAAEALGDTVKAKTYYERLLALTSGSNAIRPELAEARRFLGRP